MIAYPYIRVSHADSARSGLSPGAQLDTCRRYYECRLMPAGVGWYGLTEIPPGTDLSRHRPDLDLLYDAATSARHVPLLQRPGGARLNRMLIPGDHVIFAYLDRGFRAILDFAALIKLWQSRHINVHFADLSVDLSTPQGMMVANLMAAVAQGQSDLISERNKAIAARLRKLGRPRNGNVGLGYRLAGPKGHRYAVADDKTRAIMAEVVRLRDEKGWTWGEISDSIEFRLCEYEGRKMPDGIWGKREWPFQKCHRAYHAYKQILQEEGPDPKRG